MFPVAVSDAIAGRWALVVVNLVVSAAVALVILVRAGEFRRPG